MKLPVKACPDACDLEHLSIPRELIVTDAPSISQAGSRLLLWRNKGRQELTPEKREGPWHGIF